MKKQLSIRVGQHTSPGRKNVNQDFHGCLIPKDPQLTTKGIAVAIADGISSSDVSQIASETAVKNFLQDYYCTSEAWSVKNSAQRVLKSINSWLYTQTQQSPHRFNKDKGYICTFSGIVFKSNTAHFFHSGDSRIYRLQQQLEQLTSDHRRIVSADTSYLTRALGIHNHLELDYQSAIIAPGEIFLLATDGVYEYISEPQITDTLAQTTDLDEAAKYLVEQAYEAGSSDNLTLQIIEIISVPDKNLGEIQNQAQQLPLPPPLQARKPFEHYDILREVYISSRSHVFLAQNRNTEQQVIIKTPSTEMRDDANYLENFLMEDWIAKRIDNPHVMKAIDEQQSKQFIYTVTEYIEGKTLTQWIRDNPCPSIDSVRSIVAQIAKGLQAFHRQEMVHQDLRPNNVMIDDVGTVKIIDFGATKVAGISELSPKNEGIVGTAQYTAPEYFLGQLGTHLSDQFSLGVLTYQMLCGELPYGNAIAKTHDTRGQQRLSYQPIFTLRTDIPGWVDHAIKTAVDIQPHKRYQEVSEFIHDLHQPNSTYSNRVKPPLMERDPIKFWKGLSFVLLCIVIFQSLPR